MKLNISLFGASGKMGQAILHAVSKNPLFQIVALENCAVAIDFSHKDATLSQMNAAAKLSKPIVIGTTGLSPETFESIKKTAEIIPILYASNFSLGMSLCLDAVKRFGTALFGNCSVDIVETHHIHKKDSPSGTALSLAQTIPSREKISIRSIRNAEEIGEHIVTFECAGERIEIKHQALSRDAFAQGALKSAQFLLGKPPGLYAFQDVL